MGDAAAPTPVASPDAASRNTSGSHLELADGTGAPSQQRVEVDDGARGAPVTRGSLLAKLLSVGEATLATIVFAACSISMTIVNKMGVHRTEAPLALLVLQMVTTAVVCIVASGSALRTQFGRGAGKWALNTPLLFILSLGTSMMAFEYVSVGAFVVVRNLGPLVSLCVELLIHKCHHPTLQCNAKSVSSTLAIAVGVALYEVNDVHFSLTGLVLLLLNLTFNVLSHNVERYYLAVEKVQSRHHELPSFHALLCASLHSPACPCPSLQLTCTLSRLSMPFSVADRLPRLTSPAPGGRAQEWPGAPQE